MRHRNTFKLLADRRGAVSFEMPAVFLVVMLGFIVPLADFAVFGYKYVSAFQALRDAGQYLQYNTPLDVSTGTYTLPSSAATINGYSISNPTLYCGTPGTATQCSSTNASVTPKYYVFTTNFTLHPSTLMKPVLCTSPNTDPCSYTLSYTERFQ